MSATAHEGFDPEPTLLNASPRLRCCPAAGRADNVPPAGRSARDSPGPPPLPRSVPAAPASAPLSPRPDAPPRTGPARRTRTLERSG